MQIGHSHYLPENCEYKRSIDYEEYSQYLDRSHLIISHGGAGCIADALERGLPLVIVPRLKKFHEHTNDHQIELSNEIAKSGRAVVVYNIADLAAAIDRAPKLSASNSVKQNNIVEIISGYLTQIK